MKIILGSGSPRRREIMEAVFGKVEVVPPDVDEGVLPGEKPEAFTIRIVNEKMDSVLKKTAGDAVLLTSDTIVTIDGKVLGKPDSFDEAFSMLKLLAGREHKVITGLSLAYRGGIDILRESSIEETSVRFRDVDDSVISRYLELVDYKDKAGSYAIQEYGDMIVDSISGSVTNVIGLPLRLLFSMAGNPVFKNIFFSLPSRS